MGEWVPLYQNFALLWVVTGNIEILIEEIFVNFPTRFGQKAAKYDRFWYHDDCDENEINEISLFLKKNH